LQVTQIAVLPVRKYIAHTAVSATIKHLSIAIYPIAGFEPSDVALKQNRGEGHVNSDH
jgi:hypothetical protein